MTVQTWIAHELTFISNKTYGNPFEDVDIDAVFTCGRQKMKVPGFWDGGNIWRIRFALPKVGKWHYSVTCTDRENESLTGSGEIICEKYDGDLEIYKRGFIKTEPHVRYFMYHDGTPFFYLGDTHWNFCCEEFDEPGEHAGDIQCQSHFKYLVDKRWEQGFNVYQSEPIGAKYNIGNGVDESDMEGFRDLDRRFQYIAQKGFVHANAQLFFPRGPGGIIFIERYEDADYLIRLGRYWAARYGAYPCLWTLGQEVDNDHYFSRGFDANAGTVQTRITKEDNPYKHIAKGLHNNDPHKQPMSAHMEYFSHAPKYGSDDGTAPSTSSFREVEGHTWYAYQWGRGLDSPIDYSFGTDGVINGQGKVCILYESKYDYLWTKHFGARSAGWLAYLNGLYGYGYGAIDIWCYNSRYDCDQDSSDGIDVITKEDKQTHWCKSVEFETAYQMKYMREFFERLQWWKLMPRFDSPRYFVSDGENYHAIATDERKTIVMYFCNGGYETGILRNLDMCRYTYQWFNPRTGAYMQKGSFMPDVHRSYRVEQKPDQLDWVLLVEKA